MFLLNTHLSFFLFLCIWWDYKDKDFPKYAKNSFNLPIFTLCYSPFCPHCIGLPEELEKYSKGYGNRTDVILTKIDCYNVPGCYRYGLKGTPHIAMVIGEKKRYWPVTNERGKEGWHDFINKQLGVGLRKIFNYSELEAAKREPKAGGTTFYLEAPNQEHPFVQSLKKLSRTYKIYNDTFVFKVIPSLSSPKLYAFYSEFCNITFRGEVEDIQNFVEENKFGQFHQYDKDEYDRYKKNHLVLLFSSTPPTKTQLESIRTLTNNRCAFQFKLGWVNANDDQKLLKITGAKASDLPFIFISDTHSIYKGKISNFWNFMKNSFGENNMKTNYIPKDELMMKLIMFSSVVMFVFFSIRNDGNKNKENALKI